jgi:hypothetical protein
VAHGLTAASLLPKSLRACAHRCTALGRAAPRGHARHAVPPTGRRMHLRAGESAFALPARGGAPSGWPSSAPPPQAWCLVSISLPVKAQPRLQSQAVARAQAHRLHRLMCNSSAARQRFGLRWRAPKSRNRPRRYSPSVTPTIPRNSEVKMPVSRKLMISQPGGDRRSAHRPRFGPLQRDQRAVASPRSPRTPGRPAFTHQRDIIRLASRVHHDQHR